MYAIHSLSYQVKTSPSSSSSSTVSILYGSTDEKSPIFPLQFLTTSSLSSSSSNWPNHLHLGRVVCLLPSKFNSIAREYEDTNQDMR
jgi:hypothetical protein